MPENKVFGQAEGGAESSCRKRIKSGRFIGSFTPKTMKRLMRIECLEQAIEWKEDALKNLKQED